MGKMMIIKLDVETGEVKHVGDENNVNAQEDKKDKETITKEIPVELYLSKINPTCITYIHAGKYYRV